MIKLAEILTILPETWKNGNSYFLDIGGGLVVDPGALKPEDINVNGPNVFVTHVHYDHIRGVESWLDDKGKFYCPESDVWMLDDVEANASKLFADKNTYPKPDVFLSDGQVINLTDKFRIQVYITPGHTEGSACLLLEQKENENFIPLAFFTGDTIFSNNIGRSDLAGGDPHKMRESILRLKGLFETWPDELVVLTGHGPVTNVESILKNNPYFRSNGLL